MIQQKERMRNSNFELMRILSMLFIVIYHVLMHSNAYQNAKDTEQIIIIVIEAIILVHVNSFVLVTGYFQCKSTRKISKVVSIINQTWFYKVLIMFILVGINFIKMPNNITILYTLLPLDNATYWYINCYLALYIISPILNIVINKISKKELRNIIITLFIIVSIISTIGKDAYFNTSTGRSLSVFILLYFIGAYIRLFPPQDTQVLKKYTTKARRLVYLLCFLLCVLLSFFCWLLNEYITKQNLNEFMKEIGSIFAAMHLSYASPIVLLQSIMYFLYFGTYQIKNKIINKIATATLGVYLIHENIFIRENLYVKMGLVTLECTPKLILYLLVLSVTIYIVCTIIELFRQQISAFISNTKITKEIRRKIGAYFNDLGVRVNW